MSDRTFMIPDIKLSWEPWFAWRPVRLLDGRLKWLCRLHRRSCHFIFFYTEYRLPPRTSGKTE